MDNYSKGEVKEIEETPIFPPENGRIIMRVSAGSKIRNLMGYALHKMKEQATKQICWNGCGNAITKTISCAEIMKRKIKGLHQITKIRYHRIEEYWEPKLEGLERLKVNKDVPAITILLSKEPLDTNEQGYQRPGSFDELWKDIVEKDKSYQKKSHARAGTSNGQRGDWNRQKSKKDGRKSADRENGKLNRESKKQKMNKDNDKEKEKMDAGQKMDTGQKMDSKQKMDTGQEKEKMETGQT